MLCQPGATKSREQHRLATEIRRSLHEILMIQRIPPEAVRHKMAKEGIDQKIIGFVLGEEPKKAKPSNGLTDEEAKAVASFKKMVKMNLPEEAEEKIWQEAKKYTE